MVELPPRSPFDVARAELHKLGITITRLPGEYRLNYKTGTDATAHIVESLEEALTIGRVMAAAGAPPASEPPLGPTGPRSSRRAMMYRHNKKLAARRAARARRKT